MLLCLCGVCCRMSKVLGIAIYVTWSICGCKLCARPEMRVVPLTCICTCMYKIIITAKGVEGGGGGGEIGRTSFMVGHNPDNDGARQCCRDIYRERRYIAIKRLYRERRYIAINHWSYREINVYGRKQRYAEIKFRNEQRISIHLGTSMKIIQLLLQLNQFSLNFA